jgi:membrane-associated phospholipid phosphatase
MLLVPGIIVLNWQVGNAERPAFFWRMLRDWYTPLVFIYYYEETEPLNQIIVPFYFDWVVGRWPDIFAERMDWLWKGRLYLDPILEYWDQQLLGFQPSVDFCATCTSPILSEIMHFGYFSYYLMIPILGFPLWFQGRKKEFDFFVVTICLIMLWSYLFFILFPSAGPKSYFPGAYDRSNFNGYLFKWFMDVILEHGEISNGAFPSSHVAMGTGILLCAFRFDKTAFWVLLPMLILLYLSTMYLREHYFVDIPSGIMVGTFFYLIAGKVKAYLDRKIEVRTT